VRIALDTLPTDVALLHQLVRDMASALDEGEIEAERLRLIIRQFQRARFGRRSEQLDPDQMAFGLEDLEADLARAEARKPCPAPAEPSKPKKPPHRAPLPPHLPRAECVLPVPHDACPDCGGALTDAGATSNEMLDWIPAQLRVVKVTRPKCACRACGTLLQAPAPERVLAGGLATPGLVAHVLVSRYADHLPLYRQSQIFDWHGLAISRSTLSDWVGAACWWLEALHDRVVAHVMTGERVFADDTTLPVLDPGRGRTKTGRLWAYTRDDRSWGGPGHPAVVFVYAPDRTAARPAEHLRGFRGILQVDGYAGFEQLAAGGAVTLAACWAHARRKFYELHQAGSPVATEALQRISALYQIEASIRGQPPAERQRVRSQQSRPLVEALKLWLEFKLAHLPGRSRLAEAIRYALNRWPELSRFLNDGRVDLDTNPVERSIRPVALGRKNSLFAGSDGGARRWAVVGSLVETAKLNGVEPYAWLRDVLGRMVDGHPAGRLDELLPWNQAQTLSLLL
jgi:transposase